MDKIFRQGLAIFLLLTNYYFGLSTGVNDISPRAKVEALNVPQVSNQLLTNYLSDPLDTERECKLLQDANNLMKQKFKEMILIIASDMKDGIRLAELLSDYNRILPSLRKKKLYAIIKQNYYLYYSEKKYIRSHIIVYPRDVPDKVLASSLLVNALNSIGQIKIILTSKKLDDSNLNRLINVAVGIFHAHNLEYSIRDFEHGSRGSKYANPIMFLPSNFDKISDFQKSMKGLINYFSNQVEKIESIKDLKSLLRRVSNNFDTYSIRQKVIIGISLKFIEIEMFRSQNEYNFVTEDDQFFMEFLFSQLRAAPFLFKIPQHLGINDELLKCF